MNPERKILSLYPQSVGSSGTNGVLVIDTRPTTGITGFGYLTADIMIGPGAATTAPTTCQILESDANDTNYVQIGNLGGGTATSATVGFVLPSIATSAASGKTIGFGVNLSAARKRFIKVSVVPGTTAVVSITASLFRPFTPMAANTTDSGGDFFLIG